MYCLVVESNGELAEALGAAIATFAGSSIRLESSLQSAALALAERPPDVLVVGDSFGEDGIPFLREQRKQLSGTRIVAYSADDTRRSLIEPLVDAYMTMPFSLADVTRAVAPGA